jgi:hypothetical protein
VANGPERLTAYPIALSQLALNVKATTKAVEPIRSVINMSLMGEDLINAMKQISGLQMEALKSKDSGWQIMNLPHRFKNKGITDYKRILYLDHEPTKTYIETLFTSAEQHNSRSVSVVSEPDAGLWVVSLTATMDSSD